MHRLAEKLVSKGWNKPDQIADGLGTVLLTWDLWHVRSARLGETEHGRFGLALAI
jgi:hypothetical protein